MKIPQKYANGKILPIIQAGNHVLFYKIANTPGEITSDFFLNHYWPRALNMFATSYHQDGAGLAAPQVGITLPMFVLTIHPTDRYPGAPNLADVVIVNPTIIWESPATVIGMEGCLSIPGFYAGVPRSESIIATYFAFDPTSQKGELVRERTLYGFEARVFQHEHDHLNGVLFPQRVTNWMLCATEENRLALKEKIAQMT